MSIPIRITPNIFNKIKHQLQTEDEIICLTLQAHIRVTMVALELLKANEVVKATIKKGY